MARIAAYERSLKDKGSSEVSTETATSTSTLTARTVLDSSASARVVYINGQTHQEANQDIANGQADPKKENILGSCVSFEKSIDDSYSAASSQYPHSTQAETDEEESEGEESMEDEIFENEFEDTEVDDECSKAALMAAIAAATTRNCEDTSYTAFFVSAEAEVVATAELTEQDCIFGEEENQVETDVEEIFQKIEETLTNQEYERNKAGGGGTSVGKVFQDLERIMFFTDVIDRNPPPSPPSGGYSAALVTPASELNSWWEMATTNIYQSGMNVYNGVERTCKEVERTLLFTDLPDKSDDVPPSPRSAAISTDVSGDTCTAKDALDTAVLSVKSGDFGIAALTSETTSSTITGPRQLVKLGPAQAQAFGPGVGKKVPTKKARSLRASNDVAPQPEPSRVFKSLEKNLFFTDLPDEQLPSTRDQTPPASVACTPRSPLSVLSLNSSLGMCQSEMKRTLFFTDLAEPPQRNKEKKVCAKSQFMSQIYADDADDEFGDSRLQQRLLARMKVARDFQQTQFGGWAAETKEDPISSDSNDSKDSMVLVYQHFESPPVDEVSADPDPRDPAGDRLTTGDGNSFITAPVDDVSDYLDPKDPGDDGLVADDGNSYITALELSGLSRDGPKEKGLELSDLPRYPECWNEKAFLDESTEEDVLLSVAKPEIERVVSPSLSKRETDELSASTIPTGKSEHRMQSDHPRETPEQKMSSLVDLARGSTAFPVIKADSSFQSVRLLVEVRMISEESTDLSQHETMSSDASTPSEDQEVEAISEEDNDGSNEGETIHEEEKRKIDEAVAGEDGFSGDEETKSCDREPKIQLGEHDHEDKEGETSQDEEEIRTWTPQDDNGLGTSHQEAAKNAASGENKKPEEGNTHYPWEDCASSLADTYATAEDHQSLHTQPCGPQQSFTTESCPTDEDASVVVAANKNDTEASIRAAPKSMPPSTETFESLLAEMKNLETAINFDLKKAHSVLRHTIEETNESELTSKA